MPAKLLPPEQLPSLVQERLRSWGAVVKTQRIVQRMKASELCARVGISDATLRRMERGDPAVGIGLFLSALLVLGMLDDIAPLPRPEFRVAPAGQRVKLPKYTEDDF